MNFKFFIIPILLTLGLVGSAFAQDSFVWQDEYSDREINEMKDKMVLITMSDGVFMIEFFPEDAPNTVASFLNLVESGYYDGIVFHRIIPGFMIQVGDPNTKDPEIPMTQWGVGGPGYAIKEEFNNIQHDRGIVSMARKAGPDSAGSQFFIIHRDQSELDGKYTVFGRLVPGLPESMNTLDTIAELDTNDAEIPLDISRATILKAQVVDGYSSSGFPVDRNVSVINPEKTFGGYVDTYHNYLYGMKFDLPYRWNVVLETGDDYTTAENNVPTQNFMAVLEPNNLEHSVQEVIELTGFTPQVLILSELRNPDEESADVATPFFSIKNGDDPMVLSNYIFENKDDRKAHLIITTQKHLELEETKFKLLQIHFTNSDRNYSIVYVNVEEYFRYEVPAFVQTLENFQIMIDGELKNVDFVRHPVMKQLISDAKAQPEPEAAPLARVDSGCLIATASYGSELAPQVQLLREIRDNTVLQTESGKSFMGWFNHFYYSFSPTIADYERESPIFKEAVKLTLTPLLASLTLLQYTDIDSEHEMLGYGIGLILLNIGLYFVAPAILITKIRSFYKLQ
jgi:peptidyl-prolyl cis-trans isomerase B (cyclophilin B)